MDPGVPTIDSTGHQDWSGLDQDLLDADLQDAIRAGIEGLSTTSAATDAYQLRDDQADVARDLGAFLSRTARSRCLPFGRIILPPRTGKTVIAAHLLERSRLHALFLVPTRTLVHQTVREMRERAPSVLVGAYFGEAKEIVPNGVNVATYSLVQRAWERGELPLAIRTAAIVFADEGHRAMTQSRMSVLRHAFLPSAVRIALTATPDYDEERTLCRFFPTLVHELTLEEAMDLGLLAPLRVWVAEVDADASKIRLVAGDYNEQELGQIMSSVPFFGATRAFRYGAGNERLPALIACGTRQQAKDLRSYLEVHRPPGALPPALVLGETPRHEREAILAAFHRGEIDTLVQVGVLVEGWNAPSCKLLIDLAPSLSRVRATQKFFRVMTRHDDKEARIFVILPVGLPFIPILPMELFGRSIDDYEPGERIGPNRVDGEGLKPLVERCFEGVSGVRVKKRIVLAERLRKPKLDPRRVHDVRTVLESCAGFKPINPPPVSQFQSLFFDHPLFLGRGSSLLRLLHVAPTRKAYAALIGRLYPETSASLLLLQAGGEESDWPTRADARHLRRAIFGQVRRHGDVDLEAGWRALTGGGEPPENPEELLLQRERRARVRELLDALPRRHLATVEAVFGLHPDSEADGATFESVGDMMNISRSRAGQLVKVSLRRMARRAMVVAKRNGMSPTEWWGFRPSSGWGGTGS